MVKFSKNVAIIGATVLLHATAAMADTEMRSGRFTVRGVDESLRDMFVYQVECEDESHCTAQLSMGSDKLINAPMIRSESLRKKVEAEFAQIKLDHYPSSGDTIYVQFEGQRATDCWSAGNDPGGVGGLCRFESQGGVETWIVIWGDMCSAQCFSGLVPMVMQLDWDVERR